MKRFVILTILIALLTSMSACGKDTPADTVPSDTTSLETIPAETEPQFVPDDLPDTLNFDDRTVTWYIGDYMSAYYDDFHAEEANGERVNDAVYNARISVEERLGITTNYYRKIVQYGDRNDLNAEIQASVMASDNAYDLYAGRNLISMMLQDSFLLDLSDNPYIDFEKPWWNQSQLNMMPGNAIYVASGDGSLSIIKHTYCVFFNQDQLNAYGVTDDLYQIVADGKWTLDKMADIAALGYNDANGNAEADYGDQFGLTMGDSNKLLGIQFAAGGIVVEKNDTGYVLQYGSERMVDIFDKTVALMNLTEGVLMPQGNNDSNTLSIASFGGNYADKTFMEGKAIMTASLVGDAAVLLGDANFEFGLLPYPKLDETQSNYIATCQRNAFFSLLSYADAELSGAVLEAWSSEAYRSIQPEYFETTLKTRYSNDSEMSAIFDLLRSSMRFDIGDYFTESLGSPTSPFRDFVTANKAGQWMSNYASKEAAWKDTLAEIWETLS